MAFTVEDGTGVLGANAYIPVAYADTYHAERGNDGWAGLDADKQEAIVKATDYAEIRWLATARGRPEFPEVPQGLNFPRLGLYDRYGAVVTGVPDILARAISEYALFVREGGELFVTPTRPEAGTSGPVTALREKVGPVETETRYAFGVTTPANVSVPAADRLMRLLIGDPGRRVYR